MSSKMLQLGLDFQMFDGARFVVAEVSEAPPHRHRWLDLQGGTSRPLHPLGKPLHSSCIRFAPIPAWSKK